MPPKSIKAMKNSGSRRRMDDDDEDEENFDYVKFECAYA